MAAMRAIAGALRSIRDRRSSEDTVEDLMIEREPFRPTPSSPRIARTPMIAPVTVRAGLPALVRPQAPQTSPVSMPPAALEQAALEADTSVELTDERDDEPSTEELEAAARLLGTDWRIDPRALLASHGIDPARVLGEPVHDRVARPVAEPTLEPELDALESDLVRPRFHLRPPRWARAGRLHFPRARKHRIALLAAAAAGALVAALIIRSFPGEASSPAVSGEPAKAPSGLEGGERPSAGSQSALSLRADQPEGASAAGEMPEATRAQTKPSRASTAAALTKPAAAARTAGATLQISSVPVAKVTVDGRPVGTTPRTVRVEPGLHRVAFIGRSGRRSRSVNVPSGGNASVTVHF